MQTQWFLKGKRKNMIMEDITSRTQLVVPAIDGGRNDHKSSNVDRSGS